MVTPVLLAAALLAPADSILLRVLTLNDFHGALESRVHGWSGGRPVGGVAALAAIFDSAAAECRCPTLRLDGGDQLQGSLFSNLTYGRTTVAALNALGLDAAALGNHEFDWGVDTLRARIGEARYAWLAANLVDSVTGRRPEWVTPWRLLERGGWRIAVVGYMTPITKGIVLPAHTRGLAWLGGPRAIQGILDTVRRERPDLTILVAHEGARCDSLACTGEIIELARALDSTRVQLIVSGHSHTLVRTVVNGIAIAQARSNGTAYGVADLVRTADGGRSWRIRVETAWADGMPPHPGVAAVLEEARPAVDRLARRPIAVLRDSLLRRGSEHGFGHLVTEAHRRVQPVSDFAIMNNTGIRRDLYPGTVTYGDVFEVQPFGNQVVRVWLTGRQLREVLEHALAAGADATLHLAGLSVRYDSRRPAGARVLEMRRADGRRILPGATYTLAVNEYLQTGGSGYTMLSGLRARRTGVSDLDALIAHLRRLPSPVVAPSRRAWTDVAR